MPAAAEVDEDAKGTLVALKQSSAPAAANPAARSCGNSASCQQQQRRHSSSELMCLWYCWICGVLRSDLSAPSASATLGGMAGVGFGGGLGSRSSFEYSLAQIGLQWVCMQPCCKEPASRCCYALLARGPLRCAAVKAAVVEAGSLLAACTACIPGTLAAPCYEVPGQTCPC